MKEIIRGGVGVFDAAKHLMISLFVGLFLISILTVLMGGSNGAALAAFIIVIGGEIVLRRRKKKSGKFGDVARGSVVQDRTDKS